MTGIHWKFGSGEYDDIVFTFKKHHDRLKSGRSWHVNKWFSSGTDIYTVLYVKEIAIGNPLYVAGSSAWCSRRAEWK